MHNYRLRASSLLLVVIATAIFALYIEEYMLLIWQQQKIINLEKRQLVINHETNALLNKIIDILRQYKFIAHIPDTNFYSNKYSMATAHLIFYNQNFVMMGCDGYKIFKIEVNNLANSSGLPGLYEQPTNYSKLRTYVAICEYVKTNEDNKNGKAQRSISVNTRFFVLSNQLRVK